MTGQPSQASRLREFAGWLQRWAAYFQQQAEQAEGRSLDGESPILAPAALEASLPMETPLADNADVPGAPGAEPGELPGAAPAHWQELTRSPGQPAHWLALFEEGSAAWFDHLQAPSPGAADGIEADSYAPPAPRRGDPREPTQSPAGEARLSTAASPALHGSPDPAAAAPASCSLY